MGVLIALLVKAVSEAAKAVIALVLVVLTFLFTLVRIVADALRLAFLLLVQLSKALIYLGIVALEIVIIVVTFPIVFQSYGGDFPALVPAAVVCIVPAALAWLSGVGFASLLAAAAVTLIVGQVVSMTDILTRSLILTGAIAGCVFHLFQEGSKENELEATQ